MNRNETYGEYARTHHTIAANFAQITGAIIPSAWKNHYASEYAHRTIEWEFIQLIVDVTLNYYYTLEPNKTRHMHRHRKFKWVFNHN